MKKMIEERDPNKEAFEETGISLEDFLVDQEEILNLDLSDLHVKRSI